MPRPTPVVPAVTGNTGYVEGQIQEERRDVHFWGGRVLIVVSILVVIVLLVQGGEDGLNFLITAIMPLVILCAVVAFIPIMMGKGSGLAKGMMSAGASMAQTAVRAGAAGARGSAGAMRLVGSSSYSVTIRRFRIKDVMGHTLSCVLTGDIAGDVMRQGDLVRVDGRKNRDGVVTTKVVAVLDSIDQPPRVIVRGRHPFGYRVAATADLIAKIASVGMLLLLVGLLDGWGS